MSPHHRKRRALQGGGGGGTESRSRCTIACRCGKVVIFDHTAQLASHPMCACCTDADVCELPTQLASHCMPMLPMLPMPVCGQDRRWLVMLSPVGVHAVPGCQWCPWYGLIGAPASLDAVRTGSGHVAFRAKCSDGARRERRRRRRGERNERGERRTPGKKQPAKKADVAREEDRPRRRRRRRRRPVEK